MSRNGDMIDIVHGSAAYSSIIPLEAHRLDNIHSRPKACTKPQNGADISSYFGFKKSNTHLG